MQVLLRIIKVFRTLELHNYPEIKCKQEKSITEMQNIEAHRLMAATGNINSVNSPDSRSDRITGKP